MQLPSPAAPAHSPIPLPALFVAHGAPTMLLQPGPAGAALARAAGDLPRPRAIVVVSAHWETRVPTIGAAPEFATIHDFYGFPPELYRVRYPARSHRAVADQVEKILRDAGFAAERDDERGLDHGAWTPLSLMYPQADIPVVALSLQNALGPAHHLRLGRALGPLLADGVLLLASGNLTHNLGDFHLSFSQGGGTPAYVAEFADWMWQELAAGNENALLAYRERAPQAVRAHPSEEHLLPLYVALGAAGVGYRPERLYHGIDSVVLAMDSYAFWPANDNPQ
ncbi:MAG TPA: class III extradiol ring-cleavage dioxygenase [Accumulibacter sp.]|uniref:DODA-type extradiol aromatic ring-opening family dioxygenase n=1 Tax=Accumulibacter sp. TaxID=2053492 RepID=UPI0025FC234D|nr:class III extradiol ring-cleavage dioxygenase [Accumulibacter sp.]MCM8597787.1 dioxygenase [Accumulibacter sp.]MCM8662591.1 dioxygenase [Accumulibacter sp.]HNC53040.1 class III extradiol ring-cleavage dioxygenase [Accumulibacter sp.]